MQRACERCITAALAERPGFALAGLSDGAARSAAFLAKGEGGEVLL